MMIKLANDNVEIRLSLYMSGLCLVGVIFISSMVDFAQFNTQLYMTVTAGLLWVVGVITGAYIAWEFVLESELSAKSKRGLADNKRDTVGGATMAESEKWEVPVEEDPKLTRLLMLQVSVFCGWLTFFYRGSHPVFFLNWICLAHNR